jgi:hypothetical protein
LSALKGWLDNKTAAEKNPRKAQKLFIRAAKSIANFLTKSIFRKQAHDLRQYAQNLF